MPDVILHAIFCAEREPNRLWDLPSLGFNHTFLREHFISVRGRYIHYNLDVISSLKKFAPDVVVTAGFNPTHLYAFGYAQMRGWGHVPMTDGTDASELSLSKVHRSVRRFVYARSGAFVSASEGGQRLYRSYGIPEDHCFKSCLCIDNDAFSPRLQKKEKPFDFLFCGRIESVKNPLFALQVAAEVAKRLGRKTSMLFVGSGSEEDRVKQAAAELSSLVSVEFKGFAAQRELPSLYGAARIFLFPTQWDPWGVVVNEACASGLPVISSPHAGVTGELVRDCENGFICDLDVNVWADRAVILLTQEHVWNDFSRRSLALVGGYTYDSAARGLVEACRYSVSDHRQNATRKAA
ncbi:glycosyltransferase [Noviherbaspirillum cavernae]|uniref:Glycosyltransferase n=1 Tax=Noviherbaspirillum cavernae TaxID=2320862 RepID=A0A418X0X3_9BURK|nr:glycosyltransferase [Noviherbaspirillum cavernae]RJG06091.1 glycosyltransferase [Noviherbaspirillum cavernae]